MAIIPFPKINCKTGGKGGSEKTTLPLPVSSRPLARIRFEQVNPQIRAVPLLGALNWLEENLQQGADIREVDINGPGDPLAEISETLEILGLLRNKYPDLGISITTLGIHADIHAKDLAQAGVKNVRLLVDAVSQKVAEKLYAWIRPGRKTIPLAEAAPMLLQEQFRAVKTFREEGCTVTVCTKVYPGINNGHVAEIAETMANAGAQAMMLIPWKKSPDRDDINLDPLNLRTLKQLQKSASEFLPTELAPEPELFIGADCSSPLGSCLHISALKPGPVNDKPNLAVVSSNGMEIDLHLGQAHQVLIYGPREDGLACLLETRPAPEPGSSERWEELAATLHDCFAVLAASAGERPRKILSDHGIQVLITDNEIENTVDVLYGGTKKGKRNK